MADGSVAPVGVGPIIDSYPDGLLDPSKSIYLKVNRRRYEALIDRVAALSDTLTPDADGRIHVLDLGPGVEVDLMHKLIPGIRIDGIGLAEPAFPPLDDEAHHYFDLNLTDESDRRPSLESYHLIIVGDVLERLTRPPSATMPWLASLLRPRGCLVVQTANAVALPNRLRMLFGRPVQPPLSPDHRYPSHVREYTIKELIALGPELGLEVDGVTAANWHDGGGALNRLYNRAERLIPKSMRSGITVIYRRPAS